MAGPRGLKHNLRLQPPRGLLDPTEALEPPLEAPLEVPLEAAKPLLKLGLPAASLDPLREQVAPSERELLALGPLEERLQLPPGKL